MSIVAPEDLAATEFSGSLIIIGELWRGWRQDWPKPGTGFQVAQK